MERVKHIAASGDERPAESVALKRWLDQRERQECFAPLDTIVAASRQSSVARTKLASRITGPYSPFSVSRASSRYSWAVWPSSSTEPVYAARMSSPSANSSPDCTFRSVPAPFSGGTGRGCASGQRMAILCITHRFAGASAREPENARKGTLGGMSVESRCSCPPATTGRGTMVTGSRSVRLCLLGPRRQGASRFVRHNFWLTLASPYFRSSNAAPTAEPQQVARPAHFTRSATGGVGVVHAREGPGVANQA